MGFRVAGRVVVVTGGASGIGAALVERVAAEGARAVVAADLDEVGARSVASRVSASAGGQVLAVRLDVTDAAAVGEAVARIEAQTGAIDVWCSNAGVGRGVGLGDDEDWEVSWRVHVLAHVHAARALLPRMTERGAGHLMITASAAGLLTEMDTAPYTVTKHGAVALAEWLAIACRGDGGDDSAVSVSCLCPQGVRTPMTDGMPANAATRAAGAFLEPAEVADAVLAAWADGRFLILPHPQVAGYERHRAADRDRWLTAMARLRAKLHAGE